MGAIIGMEILPDDLVIGLTLNYSFTRKKNWLEDLRLVVGVAMPGATVAASSDSQWDAFLRIYGVDPDLRPAGVHELNQRLAVASRTAFELVDA